MATITNNNIVFSNVQKGTLTPNGKIGRKSNGDFSDYAVGGEVAGQTPDPFINAIEIDWNGAKMDANTTINTTW